MEKAIFAAGCFWGVQHYLDRAPGVINTTVGYIGGSKENPTYEEVKSHQTGHAEAVEVEFDPVLTNFEELCRLFFEIHDPGQTNGQGPDIGPQYRSEIFYTNDSQRVTAQKLMGILREKGHTVNTALTPATRFWKAENYHQHYYDKTGHHPYCHFRIKKF
ncbi:MAG TPA: peptide-methionine (S)-S-oxide reductase MsrA [Bacteroidales bacterium]|nr:peptide-methionine (S)-S-oxide reductase MsrA [Bacteroidales bacterium]HPJ54776.1 peptide-methionine (S)-S-oxide reductase MsrA [Bacteroidales bacterium]HPQ56543.1 peptide-methionine (S)-S-oxide reductase MsrA [Bacteroidales bacterium]